MGQVKTRKERASKPVLIADNGQKLAKKDYATPKFAVSTRSTTRKYVTNNWRKMDGQSMDFQGIQVFAPVDPYTYSERKDFRSAMDNSYVYRGCRIHTTMVAGQGYTT